MVHWYLHDDVKPLHRASGVTGPVECGIADVDMHNGTATAIYLMVPASNPWSQPPTHGKGTVTRATGRTRPVLSRPVPQVQR